MQVKWKLNIVVTDGFWWVVLCTFGLPRLRQAIKCKRNGTGLARKRVTRYVRRASSVCEFCVCRTCKLKNCDYFLYAHMWPDFAEILFCILVYECCTTVPETFTCRLKTRLINYCFSWFVMCRWSSKPVYWCSIWSPLWSSCRLSFWRYRSTDYGEELEWVWVSLVYMVAIRFWWFAVHRRSSEPFYWCAVFSLYSSWWFLFWGCWSSNYCEELAAWVWVSLQLMFGRNFTAVI